MPIPIKPVLDQTQESSNLFFDHSILQNYVEMSPPSVPKKKVLATNKDASLLIRVWQESKKNTDGSVVFSQSIDSNDLLRLKRRGFIVGNPTTLAFSDKAKHIIKVMALGEGNRFEKSKKEKSYTEILASMDKQNQPGYRIPKFASENSLTLGNSSKSSEEIFNELIQLSGE